MLGDKIRKERERKGLSLKQLAAMSGTTKNYLWQIETGSAVNPSAHLVFMISSSLGVSMDYLMSDSDSSDKDNEFFAEYMRLTPDKRDCMAKIMRSLK